MAAPGEQLVLPEDLDFELEALRATYEDVELLQASAAAAAVPPPPPLAVVALPVAPRVDGTAAQYVAARLLLAIPAGYPAEPPAVVLADPRGLGDARRDALAAALAAEAAALAGELSLGHLVETALDLLTRENQPEGRCAFCLEALLPAAAQRHGGGGGAAAVAPILRLPCYHCFHRQAGAGPGEWRLGCCVCFDLMVFQLDRRSKRPRPCMHRSAAARRRLHPSCDGEGTRPPLLPLPLQRLLRHLVGLGAAAAGAAGGAAAGRVQIAGASQVER